MQNRHIGETILSATEIKQGVEKVAQQLNHVFSDAVVITVVPGGMLFTADVVRMLNFDISMDYISCPHTPGERNNGSDIIFHDNVGVSGRDIILMDDAIESGGTMKRLVTHLSDHFMPKSLSIATLFVKPNRVVIPAKQYYAYEMGNDDLLIGYGLPWQDKYRNIPYISKLKM
ncbi:phosphoribosyltransferase [Symbiopectobacterium purcellii]|uniref:Hypoxanthine phosphoribosyltransferase n=1 Tax=Symbiopectobacterium purcellii TaxID=2871826 RepID=A0ABX9AIK7_9ENTR|nr:phosphoribosyltransferase family protein [Symbiopectobacterium purcellii]QZN95012.1 hypoxanthine phosphoribosyltransferase [Symbiopectobacterium purcellii]